MLQDAYSNLSIIADKLVSVCDKFGVHVRLVDDSVFFFCHYKLLPFLDIVLQTFVEVV